MGVSITGFEATTDSLRTVPLPQLHIIVNQSKSIPDENLGFTG